MSKTQLEIDNDLLISNLEAECQQRFKEFQIAGVLLAASRKALRMAKKTNTDEEVEFINNLNSGSLPYQLIKENYRVPLDEEECDYMQPKDILTEFRITRKIDKNSGKISAESIGMALKKLGFTKVMKKIDGVPRYIYRVIKIEKSC